jgi:hypothetical protein
VLSAEAIRSRPTCPDTFRQPNRSTSSSMTIGPTRLLTSSGWRSSAASCISPWCAASSPASRRPARESPILYELCGQAMRSAKWRQQGAQPLLFHLDRRARDSAATRGRSGRLRRRGQASQLGGAGQRPPRALDRPAVWRRANTVRSTRRRLQPPGTAIPLVLPAAFLPALTAMPGRPRLSLPLTHPDLVLRIADAENRLVYSLI